MPDRVKVILVQGKHPDEPKEDNSRSSWVFDACCQLVRCGVPDDVIFSLLTDKDYGISESILEKGSGTERYAIRQIERAKACVAEPWLQEMNEKYACISAVGSKFRIARHVNGVRVYQTQDDFKKSLANEFIQVPGKDGQPVLGSKVEAWLRAKHRRSYETVQFAPGMETKDEVLNTWEGWPTDPVPADAKCDLFLEVTREIICGGDSCHFNWTMDWLAHLAQRPHEPGQIALILRGAGGLGKSFWAKRIGELVAPHFAHLTRTEHIFGKFNASVAEKLLVFGDEIFASGDKRMNAALKRLVTEETLPVERKGLDVIEEPRFFRFIVATNEAWALPTDLDDRRLCVFDVGEGRKNDHTFFRATAAEWANGGRDLFFQMLCERDISRFNHRDRPVTKALTDQKLYSLRGPERIVFEMLWAGAAPIIDYRECPSPDPFTGKSRECFISTLQMAGDKVTNKALSKQLARVSTEVAVRHRNVRGAWLKPLPEARAAFCASFNLQITWPQDDGQWANTELQPDMLKAVR